MLLSLWHLPDRHLEILIKLVETGLELREEDKPIRGWTDGVINAAKRERVGTGRRPRPEP